MRPMLEVFEEFTTQWQFDHRGKYPTAFDYFLAIWELAKKDDATEIQRLKIDLDTVYSALQRKNNREKLWRKIAMNTILFCRSEINDDAARYIWLREKFHGVNHPLGDALGMSEVILGDDIDAAIDREIAKQAA